MKLVNGISDIVDDYDVFLLDMWGVMHDGFTPYEGVIDTVQKLKAQNKKMIILSNSSQRKEKSLQNLQGLGFENPTQLFGDVITSGEVAFQLLLSSSTTSNEQSTSSTAATWDVLTKIQALNAKNNQDNKIHVLGTSVERDLPYIESSGWKLAPIEQADLILACGTFSVNGGSQEINKREDAASYETALSNSLQVGAQRGVPMLVSNPDKVRPDYERPPMPGKLGDLYERALIKHGNKTPEEAQALVKRIGKPFRDVYDIALRQQQDDNTATTKIRACMVGDALETDITGGSATGIDTIWILKDGVYMPEFDEAEKEGKTLLEASQGILQDFNKNKEESYAKGKPDQVPTIAMPHFRW